MTFAPLLETPVHVGGTYALLIKNYTVSVKMTALRSSALWIVFNFVWTFTGGDIGVHCEFRKNCILPCTFTPGDEPVIHWLLGPTETKVHTYYHQQDQLTLQAQPFKGRTSLFKDEISRGNASLLLTDLQFQDQGKYKCYTSTIKGHQDSFINLMVEAPVSNVAIKKAEDTVTCTSGNIYPEPELIWSTDPPSNINLMNPTTTVQQTEQQLYNIGSVLKLSDIDANIICTISTKTSKKKATLFKPSSISESGTETTIPCTAFETIYTHVIWRFNNSQLIVTQSNTEKSYSPSKAWEKHVKGLSESGSLTLKDLSSNQEGMYTCELSNSDDRYIKNTMLQISEGSRINVAGVAVGVIATVIVVVALVVIGVVKYRRCKKNDGSPVSTSQESEVMTKAEDTYNDSPT